MPYYTEEEIARAREIDLLTYLQERAPEELIHVGFNVYSTRSHDSVKISNGMWYQWSRGVGGKSAVDYLMKVEGMSLPDAVGAVTGLHPAPSHIPTPRPPPPPFVLPPKHADNRRVFAYLRSRGIDPEVINHCIKAGQLYEDAQHHNCVFVGFEGDVPRYAMMRSTCSDSTFVREVPGSDKRFAFSVPKRSGDSHTLCVFESTIDVLSYLTLIKLNGKLWHGATGLSLGGVARRRKKEDPRLPLAMEQFLTDNPQIQRVVLCLDNDDAGREATQWMVPLLGKYEVLDNPPHRGKDYNDQLQLRLGIVGRVKTRGGGER